MILSDSHCHLDQYHNSHLNDVLGQATEAEVGLIVTMGMTLDSSAETVRMAQAYDNIYAAVGIHPFFSVLPTDNVKNGLDKLARNNCVVAIGEIGLDYLRKPETRDTQKELLQYELTLARELDLPVSIHCRDAYKDAMYILKDHVKRGLRGWIHAFFAGPAELDDWLELGFYISPGFKGIVHTENEALQEAIRHVPENRLLIETDCANTKDAAGPHDVVMVAQKLAALRGTSLEYIAHVTTTNLKRILGLGD